MLRWEQATGMCSIEQGVAASLTGVAGVAFLVGRDAALEVLVRRGEQSQAGRCSGVLGLRTYRKFTRPSAPPPRAGHAAADHTGTYRHQTGAHRHRLSDWLHACWATGSGASVVGRGGGGHKPGPQGDASLPGLSCLCVLLPQACSGYHSQGLPNDYSCVAQRGEPRSPGYSDLLEQNQGWFAGF